MIPQEKKSNQNTERYPSSTLMETHAFIMHCIPNSPHQWQNYRTVASYLVLNHLMVSIAEILCE